MQNMYCAGSDVDEKDIYPGLTAEVAKSKVGR